MLHAVLVVLTLVAAPQRGLDWDRPVPPDRVEEATREVSASLRCPVCQALSVNDSPSELAVQMKELVRERLEAGETPSEVQAYFEEKYGEFVLLDPKAEGFNLLVYILPVGMVVVGGAVLFFALRRWTGEAVPPENASAASGDKA